MLTMPGAANHAKPAARTRNSAANGTTFGRSRKNIGFQDRIELFPAEQFLLQHQFVDAAAAAERLLRDAGRIRISNMGIERGNNADGVFNQLAQMLAVGGDAGNAALPQRIAAAPEMREAFEQAVGDNRLKCVQLELPG